MKQCFFKRPHCRFVPFSLLLALFFLFSTMLKGQDSNNINGVVLDNTGEPLVGAIVYVKNTPVAVNTDLDGKYSIKAERGSILVFKLLGFRTQEITVGSNKTIDVTLEEDYSILDEVIVVGYGRQKRRDVVGAIEQISGDVFEDRSNPSVVRSLQGEVPGLNITMADGKPSRSSNLRIRSVVNSIGSGGEALVMVDGVETDITTVNPDDIESISVLKDASSTAVYGSRGTFGVILVTTKKTATTEKKPKIKYNGSYSVLQRTVEPDIVTNGLQYADSFYEAWYNYKGTIPGNINNVFLSYVEGGWNGWYNELKKRDADPTLEKWRINSKGYYEYYGNTDWHDIIFRDHTWATQHNVSISGGSDKTTYYVSGRYFEQGSIYNAGNEEYKQYNVRARGSVQVTPWLNIENSTDFIRRKQHEPLVMYSNNSNDMNQIFPIQRQMEQQAFPMALETNPDGTWTEATSYIGWAGFKEGTSFRETMKFDMRNTTAITLDILKDQLVARADFSYYYNNTDRDQVGNLYDGYVGPDIAVKHQVFSYLENRKYRRENIAANATLTYTPKFRTEDHSLKLMGGWNLEDRQYKTTLTHRQGLLVPNMPNWSLLDGEVYKIQDNGSNEWGSVGLFFRGNYSYKGKYLAEVSGRYDGLSKFPAGQKWGFFPSASVGYRLSEEKPIKDALGSWAENIKIRGSVGSAGNGLLSDPYTYYSLMNVSRTGILINGVQATKINTPTIIPDGLTWETSTTYNLGLDIDLFDGRLNFVGDIYRKDVKDMYVIGDELPAVAGYDPPKGNYADMRTNGWELSLAWRDTYKVAGKDFTYRVKASLWDSKSKITRFTSTTNTLPSIYSNSYYEGMTVGEIWGYRFDGFFKDAADVAYSPSQVYFANFNGAGNVWEAGDVKFKDLNGDNVINPGNNTLDNHGDLEVIGNTSPRYMYGLNLSVSWNNIGLSMFWQGVGQRDWYPAKESSYFWGQYGRPYGFALPWHNSSNQAGIDENGVLTNPNAYWPRLRSYIAEVSKGIMSQANDHFLQDASYIRLKNITIDYTLPSKISRKMGMESLKFYVTGENLFTYTPMHKWAKNFDPEVIGAGDPDYYSAAGGAGDGYSYPMMRSITFGVNVSF